MYKHKLIFTIGLLLFLGVLTNQVALYAAPPNPVVVATTVPLSEELFVPAGEALIGCSADTGGMMECAIDAQPIHAVYLDAYYIDKTEVSNAQYADCVAAGVCLPPIESGSSSARPDYYGNPFYDNYPVLHMDWDRANTYCNWLGKRIPTEAEWEKAARGPDRQLFPWGDEAPTCDHMNFAYSYFDDLGYRRTIMCVGETTPVDSYSEYASPYGALNMTGNAQEWVHDLYEKHYYATSPYSNPMGPATTVKNEHHIRGGPWAYWSTHVNTWVRTDEGDIYQTQFNGFRCARPVPGEVPPTDTPTPTPTLTPPAPTPTPYAHATIDAEGDTLWVNKPDHLTLLTVPENTVNQTSSFTLTYDEQARPYQDLMGIHHYFTFTAEMPNSSTFFPIRFAQPLQLILAFEPGPVKEETLQLYRLGASGWTTDAITIQERSHRFIRADIEFTGVYGLMGESNIVYLPSLLRQ